MNLKAQSIARENRDLFEQNFKKIVFLTQSMATFILIFLIQIN
jgi:hypothetical protein